MKMGKANKAEAYSEQFINFKLIKEATKKHVVLECKTRNILQTKWTLWWQKVPTAHGSSVYFRHWLEASHIYRVIRL